MRSFVVTATVVRRRMVPIVISLGVMLSTMVHLLNTFVGRSFSNGRGDEQGDGEDGGEEHSIRVLGWKRGLKGFEKGLKGV